MSNLSDLTAGTWNVDASHSEIGFAARHAMVSKIRGHFTEFAAVVTITQPFEQSTVEATVQMGSVDTHSAGRDTHVKSANLFDVENNPTMTFKSTMVTDDSLKGDLTIKGITKPVSFDLDFGGTCAADPWGGTRAGLAATTQIHSKDFDLKWSHGLAAGGVLIGEKVKIDLYIELIRA